MQNLEIRTEQVKEMDIASSKKQQVQQQMEDFFLWKVHNGFKCDSIVFYCLLSKHITREQYELTHRVAKELIEAGQLIPDKIKDTYRMTEFYFRRLCARSEIMHQNGEIITAAGIHKQINSRT